MPESFDRNPKRARRVVRAFQSLQAGGTTVINNPGGGTVSRSNSSIGPTAIPVAVGGLFARLANASAGYASGLALKSGGVLTTGAPTTADADSTNGLQIVANAPLVTDSQGLRLAYSSGLTVNASSQLVVNVASNVGLSAGAGGLTTVFKSNGGLAADAGGMYINLASTPGLSIGGCGTANGLCVLLKSGGGISKDADGLYLTSSGGGDITLVEATAPSGPDTASTNFSAVAFTTGFTVPAALIHTTGQVIEVLAHGRFDNADIAGFGTGNVKAYLRRVGGSDYDFPNADTSIALASNGGWRLRTTIYVTSSSTFDSFVEFLVQSDIAHTSGLPGFIKKASGGGMSSSGDISFDVIAYSNGSGVLDFILDYLQVTAFGPA